jgi:nitrate reductase gamma subunit
MTVLQLLEGPVWTVTSSLFAILVIWRLGVILLSGRGRVEARPVGSPIWGAIRAILVHFIPKKPFRRSGKVWFVTLAGYSFHLGLFAVLLFAAPHVAFVRDHLFALNLPVLPRWGFIVAAEFAFIGLLALWVRRFVDPVVKLISRKDDHIAAGLTFLVMLTGCMALAQSVDILRAIHLGLVEIWLLYFPFSSLMHTFTWPLSRGFTGAQEGRRGTHNL